MDTTTKIAIGAPVTLGVNLGIQHFVAMGLPRFKSDLGRGINAKTAVAAGLGLAASAGSLAVFGPIPALLGAIESLTFLGVEAITAPAAAATPAPAAAPAPAPAPAAAPAPPKLTTAQKYTAAASQYLPAVMPVINQLFSMFGNESVLNVESRRR